jgi:hypothetical protein
MNSRERLIAVARGGEVDQKPVICWPADCPESDAVVGQGTPTQISLTKVVNPFGQALRKQQAVWETLAEDPTKGAKELDGLVALTRNEINGALDNGADGVLYLLYGARGMHTTPMEYGGHYLERDRELLAEIEDTTFNMIFVVGEDDAYLDFVSDLPAHAFAWDSRATGTTVDEMRAMRTGALATNGRDADIDLRFGTESLSADLELELQETHE